MRVKYGRVSLLLPKLHGTCSKVYLCVVCASGLVCQCLQQSQLSFALTAHCHVGDALKGLYALLRGCAGATPSRWRRCTRRLHQALPSRNGCPQRPRHTPSTIAAHTAAASSTAERPRRMAASMALTPSWRTECFCQFCVRKLCCFCCCDVNSANVRRA